VENVVTELEESKCIAVQEDDDSKLSALNLGLIASYYYIQYSTVHTFISSVTEKTKVKGVLEIMAASSELSQLTLRQGEDKTLKRIAQHLPQSIADTAKYDDASTKALVLLQSHFSRQSLSVDLAADLKLVLTDAIKLLQALVDVISSQGWLKPALAAMEVSQMVVQGLWNTSDAVLLQIPHFTEDIVKRCRALTSPVETVFDLLELEDDVRTDVLQMSPEKLSDVAMFCNAYPNVELAFELLDVEGEVCNYCCGLLEIM
jgi:pre-mRNA-splicing helicase BRR2